MQCPAGYQLIGSNCVRPCNDGVEDPNICYQACRVNMEPCDVYWSRYSSLKIKPDRDPRKCCGLSPVTQKAYYVTRPTLSKSIIPLSTVAANCMAVSSDPEPHCETHILAQCPASNSAACLKRIATINPNNRVFQGVCDKMLAGSTTVDPTCVSKLASVADSGAADTTSFRFRYCSKALEKTGVLPQQCRDTLNLVQRETMLRNVCNANTTTLQTKECKDYCRANPNQCYTVLRNYCKDGAAIVRDPYCQEVLADANLWGKFDDVMMGACSADPNMKKLDLCNCLNPDKLAAFRQMFPERERLLVKAECLMPECVDATKKVYLSNTQKSINNCPPVCYQGNQIEVSNSRVGPLNITQNCFGSATPAAPAPPAVQPPIHCQVSDWGAWGTCDTTCGVGIKKRSRAVTVQPANAGIACPTLEDAQVCVNNSECPAPVASPVPSPVASPAPSPVPSPVASPAPSPVASPTLSFVPVPYADSMFVGAVVVVLLLIMMLIFYV
jgi:hypothetical protein